MIRISKHYRMVRKASASDELPSTLCGVRTARGSCCLGSRFEVLEVSNC